MLKRQQTACPAGATTHTIKAGDTFYSLAQQHKTTVFALFAANPGVNPYDLKVGQTICIPAAVSCPTSTRPYVVQAGDTFFFIAKNFNISMEALMQANPGVAPWTLQIGQVLCIPTTATTPPTTDNIYSNYVYNVTFNYPSGWREVSETRYEGPGGFFQISAIESDKKLAEVCKIEAQHKLKPYGSRPKAERTTIQGQPGCFIFPSEDQPADMKEQAALIVQYPQPITINGRTYRYFVLWADKDHLRHIAQTLRFLS